MGGYWIGKNRNGERFAEDRLTNRCQRCGFPTHLAPVAFASAQSRNCQSVPATFMKILVESAAPKGRLGIPAASKMAPKSVSRVEIGASDLKKRIPAKVLNNTRKTTENMIGKLPGLSWKNMPKLCKGNQIPGFSLFEKYPEIALKMTSKNNTIWWKLELDAGKGRL